ncbi:MFS transporter [Marinobacter salinisoli]|uniref:MFS transporter n=1 Tax=Marinobacter salinisoli TaxID=2769486 RepID=A0ABX7MP20_9GAMM|nr:MFS transporter [Marinobacter salinisoli]QSP94030.1 MFS transporter [Marinobacter salinisoli]
MPLNVWILVASQALALCTAPFIVFIGSIQGRLLASDPQWATLPVGLVVVGTVLAVRPAAWLTSRLGRKRVMLLGAAIGVGFSLVGAMASWLGSFGLLCFAAFGAGTGLAVVHQYRFAAMESVPPELGGSAASRVLFGGLIAAWLGPEIAGLGAGGNEAFPFLTSWLALAAAQAAALMVLGAGYRGQAELTSHGSVTGGRPTLEILKSPLVLAAMSSAAVGYAVMSFIMTATPLSMTEIAQHDLDDAKRVIQLHIMAMYLPSLVSGWLTRVIGIPVLMITGLLLYVGCIGLAASGISFHHYLGALLMLGVGWNFLFVGGTALLPDGYREEERFRVQGINDTVVFGAQATAALSAGAVLAAMGWDGLVVVAIPFVILHGVLMALWLTHARSPEPAKQGAKDDY